MSVTQKGKRSRGEGAKPLTAWRKRKTVRLTTATERFWQSFRRDEISGCWIWTGKIRFKYGAISRYGKWLAAHRFSWELHNGPIPRDEGYHGTCVLHSCDNPACVNPKHLFLGTQTDNIRDMISKGRKVAFEGSNHPRAKLTESDVIQIRASTESNRALAKKFKVAFSTIGSIKSRQNWSHVP